MKPLLPLSQGLWQLLTGASAIWDQHSWWSISWNIYKQLRAGSVLSHLSAPSSSADSSTPAYSPSHNRQVKYSWLFKSKHVSLHYIFLLIAINLQLSYGISCVRSLGPDTKWNMRYYSPIPCFESIAGSLEEVAFHHHSIWGIDIKLHLWVIIGEVLHMERDWGSNTAAFPRWRWACWKHKERNLCQDCEVQAELSLTARSFAVVGCSHE